MPFWIELLVSACLIIGSIFALIGAIGLYRLPDFYTRLHGPTKATTLGVGGIVIASMIFFSSRNDGLSLHELLITMFLFITAPVSAHILAKAAMQQKLSCTERTRGKPWD
ncbi:MULTISPECIES: Na+/H+ antiporter subunit G [Pseudomonadaceae]|uniref:Na+/H+ antiporter subunit G n=1 Tax=Pseudomonadaceae TaxID=135621 RepID=UPI00103B833D|nr:MULTISPECIES: Na+/H+ antiporter subunit G [Pseudomonadaceae]MBA1278705.1 Na+/H+ antiporter subunit G [Stutzerimonas stutzeri]MBC8648030.1 Na+/H+ antiporter subunit G [Pseudomonas sp. MT4]QXY93933.1 Na+/H+ antiporter subunit G [Pseudomonas sp. MTM4]TCD23946.1 Na+/H+ antiporter subunit G [Pseudomonas sp. IC_126]